MTDPHLFADPNGRLRGVETLSSLDSVLAHYRHSDWRADVVIATGDLIQDDSALAYQHFRDRLATLELPVYCLPGNHDVRDAMRSALSDPPFFYCQAFAAHGWLLVSLDSCVDGRAGGRVSESELARANREIRGCRAPHVMVCLHHPPVPMRSRWLDSVGLDDGAGLLTRLARSGKVRVVVAGHVHQDYDALHAGIRVIATPSTCRQFKPRSDDFAVDASPPAYRRFSLYPDGRVEHQLIWVKHA